MFWAVREEMSVRNITIHAVLEGNHCWVLFIPRKKDYAYKIEL